MVPRVCKLSVHASNRINRFSNSSCDDEMGVYKWFSVNDAGLCPNRSKSPFLRGAGSFHFR